MSPSRSYDPIDDEVAALILDLHKRHPNLGHNGLIHALEDEKVEVDPQALEQFMEENDIEGEHWQHQPNSLRGLPLFPFFNPMALNNDTGDDS